MSSKIDSRAIAQEIGDELRRRNAFHESGHVVACYRLGLKVFEATAGMSNGLTLHESASRHPPMTQAIVSLAGATAERMHCGEGKPSDSDVAGVTRGVKRYADAIRDCGSRPDPDGFLARAHTATVTLLVKDWPLVEHVAAMLQRGKLKGIERLEPRKPAKATEPPIERKVMRRPLILTKTLVKA